MSDKFILDVVQASELKHAWFRNGGTNADLKDLCSGDMVAKILPFLRGQAEIVVKPVFNSYNRSWIALKQPRIVTSDRYFKEAGVAFAGGDFKREFVDIEVPEVENCELSVKELENDFTSPSLLFAIRNKAEIRASQLADFLYNHRRTTEWFIFYLRGKDGNLWLVSAYWETTYPGWEVEAFPSSFPNTWSKRYKVVYCK